MMPFGLNITQLSFQHFSNITYKGLLEIKLDHLKGRHTL